MWCRVDPAADAEFEAWHSREHLPERLGIPGFLDGSRWKSASGPPRYFLRYRISGPEVFASAAYRARLDAPSDWTRRMMPHIGGMTRGLCRQLAGAGSGTGRHLATCRIARLSCDPPPGLALPQGVAAIRLLQGHAPQGTPAWEERARGGDSAVDLALLAEGDRTAALRRALAATGLPGPRDIEHFTLRDRLSQGAAA